MKNPFSEKAHEHIRRKILAGVFKPGHRLKTHELTAQIGVSATPVREALRLLETEGLVEIKPRQGASVKSLDIVGFKELSEVRCALECLAAELAAVNRSEGELAEMKQALDEMGDLISRMSNPIDTELRQKLRTTDIHFHVSILAAAHNETLYSEVLRLQAIHRINSPGYNQAKAPSGDPIAWLKSVHDCHIRIFEGIRTGNAEAARLAMKEHIQGIVDRAVLALAMSVRGRSIARLATEAAGYLE